MYESHITIEPLFAEDEKYSKFLELCTVYGFKPAKLVMIKDRESTPERSNRDSFCTGHHEDFIEIYTRTLTLVGFLRANNIKVWRYKIESIIVDVRIT